MRSLDSYVHTSSRDYIKVVIVGQQRTYGAFQIGGAALRVLRGYKVTVYEYAGFRGHAKVFTSSNSCLVNAGFNDKVSSVKVQRIR